MKTANVAAPKYTPGPWRLVRRDSGWDIKGGDRSGYTKEIAIVFHRGDEVQLGNAARIVSCVNAHDDLVAALAYCASAIKHHLNNDGRTDPQLQSDLMMDLVFAERDARAALAKVQQ